MNYHTESKLQNWRALAVFADGGERLLCVGRSTSHVRAAYATPYADLLDEGDRARVGRICLQTWQGAADQGCWVHKADLPLPSMATADSSPNLLPFRRKPTAPPAAVSSRKLKKATGT